MGAKIWFGEFENPSEDTTKARKVLWDVKHESKNSVIIYTQVLP